MRKPLIPWLIELGILFLAVVTYFFPDYVAVVLVFGGILLAIIVACIYGGIGPTSWDYLDEGNKLFLICLLIIGLGFLIGLKVAPLLSDHSWFLKLWEK